MNKKVLPENCKVRLKNWKRLKGGEVIVADDDAMDFYGEMASEENINDLRSIYNPKRVGILDKYLVAISKEAPEKFIERLGGKSV